MESYPDTVVVSKNVDVALHHPAEKLNRYQRLYYRISRQQKGFFFYTTHMGNGSFIQDSQGYDILGADASPHWEFSFLLNDTLFVGISAIYCPHSLILRIIDTVDIN